MAAIADVTAIASYIAAVPAQQSAAPIASCHVHRRPDQLQGCDIVHMYGLVLHRV
jgi:hypothetical protein